MTPPGRRRGWKLKLAITVLASLACFVAIAGTAAAAGQHLPAGERQAVLVLGLVTGAAMACLVGILVASLLD